MCSIDSGLWCWDATTQAASDDAPSQRRGWRGVLSFSFEVRVRQGRVTLPCKSLRGVRAPNTYFLVPGELSCSCFTRVRSACTVLLHPSWHLTAYSSFPLLGFPSRPGSSPVVTLSLLSQGTTWEKQ